MQLNHFAKIPENRKTVFDREGLSEKLDHDGVVVKEIIRIFLDDVPERIERLRNAVAAGDAAVVAVEAHTIKGSAATIMAGNLQKAASSLETAAEDADRNGMNDMFIRLNASFMSLMEILERVVNENGV
jgi:HPt (histidine-containing phosphotransfer) domain-containing protein